MVKNMYKSKLQEFCHEKKCALPRYSSMKDGPDHNPMFKASVVVNGINFDTLHPCKSLKQAHNQVATLALLHFSSGSDPAYEESKTTETYKNPDLGINNPGKAAFQESMARSYKSRLQELAQSKGDFMPAYKTSVCGKPHNLTFLSTVEIDGEVFHGTAANSKKQAEDNAAKVAYLALIERKPHKNKTHELGPLLESLSLSAQESEPSHRSAPSTEEMKTYLLCKRVKVYKHIPNMSFPKGSVVVPIREGEWVVANLEFPNEK